MLFMPSIFSDNLMDDWMKGFNDEFFGTNTPAHTKSARNIMRTDIKEKDGSYELDIDLPGFKKEDIHLELADGNLNIQAVKNIEKDEKNEDGKLIRQERYAGSMARSFYVGDEITEEDVHARFENGVLSLSIPKKQPEEQIPEKKVIAIEG